MRAIVLPGDEEAGLDDAVGAQQTETADPPDPSFNDDAMREGGSRRTIWLR